MLRALFCLAALTLLCGRASFGASKKEKPKKEEPAPKEKKKRKKEKPARSVKPRKEKPDRYRKPPREKPDKPVRYRKPPREKPDKPGRHRREERDGDSETFDRSSLYATEDYDSEAASDADVLEVFVEIVTLPFWGPHRMLEDDFGRAGFFLPHPYAAGGRGYMVIDRPGAGPPAGVARPGALRVCVEDSYDFYGVNRLSGHLLVSTGMRGGVEASVTYRTEGGAGGLVIGDANFVYRFAQSETMQFRAGLGVLFRSDPAAPDAGVNFTYGADLFPGRPFVLSGSLDTGTLGEDPVFHWRLTAGFVSSRYEVYAGYDSFSVGSEAAEERTEGPVVGLRLWF